MGWKRSSADRELSQHATDTPLIPWCGKGFFVPESTFNANSLMCVSVHPCVQLHTLTSVHTLNIL